MLTLRTLHSSDGRIVEHATYLTFMEENLIIKKKKAALFKVCHKTKYLTNRL